MRRFLIGLLLLSLAAPGMAQLFQKADDLLEPEKAFRFSARAVDGGVEVRFAIADGYYMYRERFRFESTGDVRLGKPEFPAGIAHKDEFFGEMQIYRKEVRIRIPAQGSGRLDLNVVSQGCADVGVCYVPMESQASLRLAGGTFVSQAGPEVDARPHWSIFASDIDIARLFEGNAAVVLAGFFGFGLL
ncbi:MAG TPA: protein-disulfide reductase DsbD N-terminal domain-containing protein, partial [Burkholderiales bacterium]|nr:protein-disulfide reductase DsbD N-terminal domain-containing protein [Burkholderiales bacterium]